MVWSSDGSPHTITLPHSPWARIYDLYGTLLTPSSTVQVDFKPKYIELPLLISNISLPVLNFNFFPLKNGNFESGLDGWTMFFSGLPYTLVDSNPFNPLTGGIDRNIPAGLYSTQLGSIDYPCTDRGTPVGFSAADQSFSVPSLESTTTITLKFNYIIFTEDVSLPPIAGQLYQYDRFEVYITSGGNEQLVFYDGNTVNSLDCDKWHRIPSVENVRNGLTDGWATGSVNLGPYKGKNIRVSFRNYNRLDGWYRTYTYLDNVRMEITP